MSTQAKQSDNIYKQARLNAAQTNDELKTAEKASALLYFTRQKLGQIERPENDTSRAVPSPFDVKQMIDVYHAPELRNYFCTHECPLGTNIPPLECNNLDRISLQLLVALQRIEQVRDELGDILVDGLVGESEKKEFVQIVSTLKNIANHAAALELWAQKNGLL
jgi:hypothetical protein